MRARAEMKTAPPMEMPMMKSVAGLDMVGGVKAVDDVEGSEEDEVDAAPTMAVFSEFSKNVDVWLGNGGDLDGDPTTSVFGGSVGGWLEVAAEVVERTVVVSGFSLVMGTSVVTGVVNAGTGCQACLSVSRRLTALGTSLTRYIFWLPHTRWMLLVVRPLYVFVIRSAEYLAK
jgi:hypothetical protein